MSNVAENPESAPPPKAPLSHSPHHSHFSPVWIIPVISALLGLWLVWRHYSAEGPQITVRFENAEGIIAGKTPVLCRSVPVGTVTKMELTDDLKGVLVTMDMTRNAARLLAEDSQLWIVRARYSTSGISGLNTLVSGNYVELQAGVSKNLRRDFIGAENPPATPPGVPGLRFKLIAEQAGGLEPGASIVYKGITVGKLESRVFHPRAGQVEFDAFIDNEYAQLVDPQTRFYNSGGLDLKVGAEGVQLRGTLESLLANNVTFTDPVEKLAHQKPLPSGQRFILYAGYDDARKAEFNPTLPYLLLFTASVRGLSPEAPVEFRGIRVGSVVGASIKYLPDDPEHRVPVLIKIDPVLLLDQSGSDTATAQALIVQNVEKGLRASLRTASLVTNQLYVELDFQKDAPPETIANIGGYDVLPSISSSGLDELQEKAGALLDKLNALQIEKTVGNANETLANLTKLTGTGSSLDKTLKNAEKVTTELSGSNDIGVTLHNLRSSSEQLKATLSDLAPKFSKVGENLSEASDTVKRQPWRLIWPSTKTYGPSPSPSPHRQIPLRNP